MECQSAGRTTVTRMARPAVSWPRTPEHTHGLHAAAPAQTASRSRAWGCEMTSRGSLQDDAQGHAGADPAGEPCDVGSVETDTPV